jgi:hypothetical protein
MEEAGSPMQIKPDQTERISDAGQLCKKKESNPS